MTPTHQPREIARFEGVKVSLAKRDDLASISSIGSAAMREAYETLLRPATIESLLEVAYTPAALEKRWEDHPILIAIENGTAIAFADAIVETDRIVIAAIHTRPNARRRGAGTHLIARIRQLAERLPTTVDLILGNTSGESFFERRGFVPGESLEVSFFGEPVVERRWYRSALVESGATEEASLSG